MKGAAAGGGGGGGGGIGGGPPAPGTGRRPSISCACRMAWRGSEVVGCVRSN